MTDFFSACVLKGAVFKMMLWLHFDSEKFPQTFTIQEIVLFWQWRIPIFCFLKESGGIFYIDTRNIAA